MKFKLTRRQTKWLLTLLGGILVVYVWPFVQAQLAGTAVVPQPGWYVVTSAHDGDTIEVTMGGKNEKIRMIGVDTPETHHPDLPVQCYGEHASAATKEKLTGKTVRLEADPTNDNRDRYDRLLRYVFTEDGTLWNKELIARGEGFAYTSFPFVRKVEFMSTQFAAAKEKRGLWAACQTIESKGRWSTSYLRSE